MQAGSLAGLLHAGPAAASPADTPPSFDVEEKMSLEGGVVWYNVVLREPAKLTRKIVRVRWSQMEALSKALHSADGMPGFPDSVYVERKFFKTSDPDKLESRRLEVKVRAASLASATTTAVEPPPAAISCRSAASLTVFWPRAWNSAGVLRADDGLGTGLQVRHLHAERGTRASTAAVLRTPHGVL